MEYVRSDPQKGHLYKCRRDGCILRGRRGVRYCDTEVWEQPKSNLRTIGLVARASPAWKELYGLRQSIERVFKGMKESRRLERHCVRGLEKVGLHARSLSEKQCSKRYASLVECKDANYSTTKSRLL